MNSIRTKKLISSLIIISMFMPALFLLSTPKQTNAAVGLGGVVHDPVHTGVNVGNAASNAANLGISIKNVLKDIAKQVLMAVARRALAEITKGVTTWINNGFHGTPLFLQNPGSFFNDITKFEIRKLVDIFGRDPLRFPYGRQASLNFIDAYKRQLDVNAAYSLSNVIQDEVYLSNYRANFNIGGWNGFLLHTQYPQNNAIGFQMIANEELAMRIDISPGADNEIGKVRDLLQQGQGFLSPQVCRSNPSLVQNPYNPPTFNYEKQEKWDPPDINFFNGDEDAYDTYMQLYAQAYNERKAAAQGIWKEQNTCKDGWANTTPGYVVASQITRALGSNFSQTELGAALGNSLSAIFDTLFNKLINTGLNALASRTNPPPQNGDDWDYLGNRLGTSATENGYDDPFLGPDQEIILSKFKDTVVRGIADTKAELELMDNDNKNGRGNGIAQVLAFTWPKARELDICLPGPDLGWEERLDKERERNAMKFQKNLSSSDGEKVAQAQLWVNELEFAVEFFKDWVQTKMINVLPSAVIYSDAVAEVETFDQQAKELTDKRRAKQRALARLEVIETALGAFASQPYPGTQAEDDLIKVRKEYDAIGYEVSNPITLEDTRSELNAAKERLAKYNNLVRQCVIERRDKRWSVPSAGVSWSDTLLKRSTFKSISSDAAGKQYLISTATTGSGEVSRNERYTATGEEQEQFCNLPIISGYSHGPFINPNPVPDEYKSIPLVNYAVSAGAFVLPRVKVSCNLIYRATILDYKRKISSVPGVPEPDQPPPPPDDTGETGTGDPPPPACDLAIDPNCVPPPPPPPPPPGDEPPPEGCGGAGQIACL